MKTHRPIILTVTDLAVINDSCYISSGSNIFSGAINNNRWVLGRKITIPAISNNVINCLAAGKNNELWLGTNNGLGKLDLIKSQFNPIVNNEFFNADNFIADLFLDREDGLWISSSKKSYPDASCCHLLLLHSKKVQMEKPG